MMSSRRISERRLDGASDTFRSPQRATQLASPTGRWISGQLNDELPDAGPALRNDSLNRRTVDQKLG